MFDRKYAYHYLVAITVLGIASYFGDKIKQGLVNNNEDNELIRQYLLNESPLFGMNRPKLWIHSSYELNARKWKDFYSRNTNDLNQPYIHQTIKTIINHCGSDFNVCLIDDDTFSKLIPNWDINLASIAEPFRAYYRELGFAQLIYIYGGIVVPNSFICNKSLLPLFNESSEGHPFFCEELNRTTKINHGNGFIPGTRIMGGRKGCSVIKEFVEYLKKRNLYPHFSNESKIEGSTQEWLLLHNDISIIDGKLIGIKTKKGRAILLDDLMSENYLELDSDSYGVYIPRDEILSRNKYQWFAYMSAQEIFKSTPIIAKYLQASIVDTVNEYFKDNTIKSVTTI